MLHHDHNEQNSYNSLVGSPCVSTTTTTATMPIQPFSFNELNVTDENNNTNSSRVSSSSDRKKLFVGNLPPSTLLEDLVEFFGRYGLVNKQLSVVKDDNYAFVHFYADEAAELALRELNGALFKNKYIRVQYSNSNGHIKKAVSSKCKRSDLISTQILLLLVLISTQILNEFFELLNIFLVVLDFIATKKYFADFIWQFY